MEAPNKRLKLSPAEEDFVSLAGDEEDGGRYGYDDAKGAYATNEALSRRDEAQS